MFYNCSSLKQIVLPNHITSIEELAFSGCTSLETITLPASLRKIGKNIFSDCNSLKTVQFKGSRKQWKELTLNISLGYDKEVIFAD